MEDQGGTQRVKLKSINSSAVPSQPETAAFTRSEVVL
jgi:hypothetical protein